MLPKQKKMFLNSALKFVTSRSFCLQYVARKSVYQSQYNIENLFPGRIAQFGQSQPLQKSTKEEFSGYIPIDELDIKYSRSSGPGGQNVNKSNSKVQVQFHIPTANWVPEAAKERLMEQQRTKISKDGYLMVSSSLTRKQMLNRVECLDQIREMVWMACVKPVAPSAEEIKDQKEREAIAKKSILREKRKHSHKKLLRRAPSISSV